VTLNMAGTDRPFEELFAELEPDARAVVAEIVRRVYAGQKKYGRLDLATDARDLESEKHEELLDAMIYGAALRIQRRRRMQSARSLGPRRHVELDSAADLARADLEDE
jgi:hypothetical protein